MTKKFTIILIILCVSISSSYADHSRDYFCKDIYKSKVERIERNPKLRKAGQIAAGVVPGLVLGAATFGLALVIAPAAPGLALILLLPTSPFVAMSGPIVSFMELEERDQNFFKSYYLLENLEKIEYSRSMPNLIDQILDQYKMQKTEDEEWNEFVDRYEHLPRIEQFYGLKELLIKKSLTDEFCHRGKAMPLPRLIKQLSIN